MIREALRRVFNVDEPPERVALAFATGVFIGFSPLLGLQTLLAALVAVAFRLNKPAIFTGAYLSNPWTIGPIVAGSWWLGSLLIPSPRIEMPQLSLSAIGDSAFWFGLGAQWRQLLPFAVGAMIISVVGAVIAYPLMLALLRSYRRRHPGG
jgi:uncharacterized protein